MSAEFDAYAEDYRQHVERAVAFSGRQHAYFVEAKVDHLLTQAQLHCGDPRRLQMLDVGCGTGETDALLASRVAELHGVDVSCAAVDVARRRPENASVKYAVYPGGRLPYDDAAFDVAFAITVLHHVPQSSWPEFIQEMGRVVRPGGLVAIYEHNPLNPLTRWVVSRCAFDADAVLLTGTACRRLLKGAGLPVVELGHLLLFPWNARGLQWFERLVRRLPFGAQYAAIARKP